MSTLRAGVVYLGLGFRAGFLLGSIRVLFLVQRLGVRAVVLPLMRWLPARLTPRRNHG